MRVRLPFPWALVTLLLLVGVVFAAPSYRAFIEWNGPYYHVRHGLNADSSAYLDYLVDSPLPIYGSQFSSPVALDLVGTAPYVFVVDHDRRRVQVFQSSVGWRVEDLTYGAVPVQGTFGGTGILFSVGWITPGSERIRINGKFFTRVGNVTGYTVLDSVYEMQYDGNAGTGGVATLPPGWNLGSSDSVSVEYAYSFPNPVAAGDNDIDYVLSQTAPSPPTALVLHEGTSASDPGMEDLTAIAINAGVAPSQDLYVVNALPGDAGTLASYHLTDIAAGGTFSYVDTYPGLLRRPYDVEIVDNGANTDAVVASNATDPNVAATQIVPTIINQNTYLSHQYYLTYSFDTTSAMTHTFAPNYNAVDIAYHERSGVLHLLTSTSTAPEGIRYSRSIDYGITWSAPALIATTVPGAEYARPRIVVTGTNAIHAVWEQGAAGAHVIYHCYSTDGGVTWTLPLPVSAAGNNAYANLLVDPVTSGQLYCVWARGNEVRYNIFSAGSWSADAAVATTGTATYAAPHAVIDNTGRIYCAFASSNSSIDYVVFNGSVWGSYNGGSWLAGTTDPVTLAAGFTGIGGAVRGVDFPCPQIVITGDTVWVFWIGDNSGAYGTNNAGLWRNWTFSLSGEFIPASAAAISPGATDDAAPMRFTATADDRHGIHLVYPFSASIDREGLRYKYWDGVAWIPAVGSVGREIYNAGNANEWSFEPRLIVANACDQIVPMLACVKAYSAGDLWGTASPRVLYKIIDGVMTIQDRTTSALINRFRVWTTGSPDAVAVPGLSFVITNTADDISNTDDVDATEYNVGDFFDLRATTPGVKRELLFLTDSDTNRIKVIRAYDNIADCFGGAERWDVPGKSDGTPGQTYRLATVGGEATFEVWAGNDDTRWTVVNDLLIAGPTDRHCEIDRFTKEIRFGDGVHGLIPPAGAFIRVRYIESVDEASYGSLGSAQGQFNHPRGLAVRYNSGQLHYDVYVCDTDNNRLQKLRYAPNPAVNPQLWTSAVCVWSAVSSATDVLSHPEDVEVVTYGGAVYLVVSDAGNDRVVVYRDDEATGAGGSTPPSYVATIGESGNALNQFNDVRGVAVMASDSGLVLFTADAGRNVVSKILSRSWLVSRQDTSDGGQQGGGVNVLTLNATDARDNDNYLLLQPGAVRTVELRLSRTDSLVALRAVGTFPPAMLDILSINEGNVWAGERFTNKIFLYDFDNTTGRFEVNASMVGDNDGLTTLSSRVVATFVVRADSAMVIPSNGTMAFLADSSEFRKAGNRRVLSSNLVNLNVRGGYLADIASTGGNPGTVPRMIPQPDGRINFADVNVFTQGWNGDGVVFDPISDIGPYIGESVPMLIAAPDGKLDAFDLLSLSTMYNWYNRAGPVAISLPPPDRDAVDGCGSVVIAVRRADDGWTVELQSRDVIELTTAHLFLQLNSPAATITSVREGGFLGQGSTLFLHTASADAADISLGRLNRQAPGVSGSGVLASLKISGNKDVPLQLRLVYELRDCRNALLAAADISNAEVQAIPERVSLATAYPNPFNASTTFTLNLSEAGLATLRVFNMLGQEVTTVVNRELPAGVHHVVWEARDASGQALPSGVYFVRLNVGSSRDIRKIVLIR